jgi:hypothetical protein
VGLQHAVLRSVLVVKSLQVVAQLALVALVEGVWLLPDQQESRLDSLAQHLQADIQRPLV